MVSKFSLHCKILYISVSLFYKTDGLSVMKCRSWLLILCCICEFNLTSSYFSEKKSKKLFWLQLLLRTLVFHLISVCSFSLLPCMNMDSFLDIKWKLKTMSKAEINWLCTNVAENHSCGRPKTWQHYTRTL